MIAAESVSDFYATMVCFGFYRIPGRILDGGKHCWMVHCLRIPGRILVGCCLGRTLSIGDYYTMMAWTAILLARPWTNHIAGANSTTHILSSIPMIGNSHNGVMDIIVIGSRRIYKYDLRTFLTLLEPDRILHSDPDTSYT